MSCFAEAALDAEFGLFGDLLLVGVGLGVDDSEGDVAVVAAVVVVELLEQGQDAVRRSCDPGVCPSGLFSQTSPHGVGTDSVGTRKTSHA